MITAMALLFQAAGCPANSPHRFVSLASIGKTDDRWREGDTIRFSAFPSFERHAWVVEVNRPSNPSAVPVAEIFLLEGDTGCGRNEIISHWQAPLLAREANNFFTDVRSMIDRVEAEPDDEVVLDGTSFALAMKGKGGVSHIRLSPAVLGPSGVLSERIRLLAARIAGSDVPTSASWTIQRR